VGRNVLSSCWVDIPTLAQRDLSVISSARGGGAVGYACAREFVFYGFVDARFAGCVGMLVGVSIGGIQGRGVCVKGAKY
jgi:hypothetical protein